MATKTPAKLVAEMRQMLNLHKNHPELLWLRPMGEAADMIEQLDREVDEQADAIGRSAPT